MVILFFVVVSQIIYAEQPLQDPTRSLGTYGLKDGDVLVLRQAERRPPAQPPLPGKCCWIMDGKQWELTQKWKYLPLFEFESRWHMNRYEETLPSEWHFLFLLSSSRSSSNRLQLDCSPGHFRQPASPTDTARTATHKHTPATPCCACWACRSCRRLSSGTGRPLAAQRNAAGQSPRAVSAEGEEPPTGRGSAQRRSGWGQPDSDL